MYCPSGGRQLAARPVRSKPRAIFTACCASFHEHKVRFRSQPHPASTTSQLLVEPSTRRTTRQGKKRAPSTSGRTRPAPTSQSPLVPETGPGRRRPSVRGAEHKAVGSRAAASYHTRCVTPSFPDGPKPEGSGDPTAHGRLGVCLHDPPEPKARSRGGKPPPRCALGPSDPPSTRPGMPGGGP
jgi:hypothetical protein